MLRKAQVLSVRERLVHDAENESAECQVKCTKQRKPPIQFPRHTWSSLVKSWFVLIHAEASQENRSPEFANSDGPGACKIHRATPERAENLVFWRTQNSFEADESSHHETRDTIVSHCIPNVWRRLSGCAFAFLARENISWIGDASREGEP